MIKVKTGNYTGPKNKRMKIALQSLLSHWQSSVIQDNNIKNIFKLIHSVAPALVKLLQDTFNNFLQT
jgi:hypothetical protein